jgi:hypothetical protein
VFRSQALNPDIQRLDALDSGEPSMDTWLSEHASGAEARRVARTFVWTTEDQTVRAYYSLTGHRIVRDELPKSVGRGSPSEVPAVLLARLALDKSLHGQGSGGVLLADALERIVVATQTVAARIGGVPYRFRIPDPLGSEPEWRIVNAGATQEVHP